MAASTSENIHMNTKVSFNFTSREHRMSKNYKKMSLFGDVLVDFLKIFGLINFFSLPERR